MNCCGQSWSSLPSWAVPQIESANEHDREAAARSDEPEELSLQDKIDFLKGGGDKSAAGAPGAAAQSAVAPKKCETESPLVAATIYCRIGDKATILATAERLDQFSFWYRSQAGEFIRFGSRQVAQHISPGESESILPDDEHSALQYCCHGYREAEGVLVATAVAAPDYHQLTVYRLLKTLVRRFREQHGELLLSLSLSHQSLPSEDTAVDSFPLLEEFLSKYQNPEDADRVPQIKKELADTQEVLFKTLDQILSRGQSMEQIMESSQDLSSASMTFYKTSKRSRCCTIL